MGETENSPPKPSLRVLEKIADAEDVAPADLHPPLHAVVDPTALDRLFEPTAENRSGRTGRVSFGYRGYEVTVRSNGNIEMSD
ncbi:HalOD1 output domain-containing protein [Halomontanus rarus]|uniref:HalOD1 output domain-containing protein n=1 Tax=Halomontanus rarus TaxID=3034020 RepID=UPI0023E86E07|nr:HalOD1 output domain-containing protein [Halovivax sp. TS33]